MSDLPSGARALLSLTRDAHDPDDPEARNRVRQRVAMAVGASAVSLGAAGVQAATRKGFLAGLAPKLALVTSMAALAGAGSLYLAAPAEPPRVQRVENSVEVAPLPRVSSLAPEVSPLPVVGTLPAPTVEELEEPRPALAATAPVVLNVPKVLPRPAETRAAPAKPAAESLPREIALLREAEHALEASDPKRARSLLAQHKTAFPHAMLSEERDGLTAWARCLEVPGQGTRTAQRFLAHHPRSVLRARLEQSCQLTQGVP
jgi:hypothetical protein